MSNSPATNRNAAIGANVRAEMSRRQVSQARLGEVLGLQQTSISKRLRGTIPFDIDELLRIADYLDVPLGALTAIDQPGAEVSA